MSFIGAFAELVFAVVDIGLDMLTFSTLDNEKGDKAKPNYPYENPSNKRKGKGKGAKND